MPSFLILEPENPAKSLPVLVKIVIPENARLTYVGEAADQDGLEGKLYRSAGGKLILIEQ